jgi:hypothetical protein
VVLHDAHTLPSSIGKGWPLDTQHLGEERLRNSVVTTVPHHEHQRASRCLRLRPVARDRHQDLLEKGLNVGIHESSEDGIDPIARMNAARDIFAKLPGIWTKSRLAPKTACTPLHPSRPIVAISMTLPSEHPATTETTPLCGKKT